MSDRGPGIFRSLHFWAVLALFAACCILHYPALLPLRAARSLTSLLGLQRHALERILFLVPVVWTAYVFGIRPGAACLLLAALAMLPRAFLLSPAHMDALFEIGMIVGLGGLIIAWLESRRREIGRREQDILKLERVKRELESHVRASRENERRIRTLHSISRIINQSFSLREVAAATAAPIRDLLCADAVLIYLKGADGVLKLAAQSGLDAETAREPAVRTLKKVKEGDLPSEGPLFLASAADRGQPFAGLVRRLPRTPLAALSFRARDILAGLLCAALPAPVPSPRAGDERERLLSLLGSELGVAAERAYYFRELERVSLQFREVFEKAHDAIWLQNRNGDIVSANRAAARLSGYSPSELVTLNAARLCGPGEENRAREVEEKLLAAEPVRQPYEQRMVRKDGSPAVLMQTTSLLGAPQAPVFLHIARDISDERRLRESLRLYAGQISRAHEDERLRIARELHDDTVQTLVSIYGRLDRVLSAAPGLDEQSRRRLEEIHAGINDCMVRIRRFTQDLRPPTLDVLGLHPTLRELAGQTAERSGLKIELLGAPPRPPLAAEEELLVYRIVQEAVRNVVKHAGGARAEIRLEEAAGALVVEVMDDGRGFTVDPEAELVEKGKLGLMGMKERAYLLGGNLKILSTPGGGTTIRLSLPRRPP